VHHTSFLRVSFLVRDTSLRAPRVSAVKRIACLCLPLPRYNPPMPAATRILRIGTSAFTAAGWPGTFYPAGCQPADYLTYYATRFDTVEIDSTYYRTPSLATVRGWARKTPPDFIFAAKVPQSITHEKVLVNCDEEFQQFVETMDGLGEKLGPLLLQFPYFNQKKFKSVNEFLAVLVPFLKKLPRDHKFALEIRNKNWIVPQFMDALRERNVAFTLVDQSWMPRPAEIFARLDPITADFLYVRLLGDRKGIEELTKTWDKTIIDRDKDLKEWATLLARVRRQMHIFLFANNHYAGHAPATVERFLELWRKLVGDAHMGCAQPDRARSAAALQAQVKDEPPKAPEKKDRRLF